MADNNPHRQVDADCCPSCKSKKILDDETQPGKIFKCGECGNRLVELKRDGIFGEQRFYVDVQRRGLAVFTEGKYEADG